MDGQKDIGNHIPAKNIFLPRTLQRTAAPMRSHVVRDSRDSGSESPNVAHGDANLSAKRATFVFQHSSGSSCSEPAKGKADELGGLDIILKPAIERVNLKTANPAFKRGKATKVR